MHLLRRVLARAWLEARPGVKEQVILWGTIGVLAIAIVSIVRSSPWSDVANAVWVLVTMGSLFFVYCFVRAPIGLWRDSREDIRELVAALSPPTWVSESLTRLRATREDRMGREMDALDVLGLIVNHAPGGTSYRELLRMTLHAEPWRHGLTMAQVGAADIELEGRGGIWRLAEALSECSAIRTIQDDALSGQCPVLENARFVVTGTGVHLWRWNTVTIPALRTYP